MQSSKNANLASGNLRATHTFLHRRLFNLSTLKAYLFLSPFLSLLIIFALWPVLFGTYLAFTEYNMITPPKWVGWKNIETLLEDEQFLTGVKNSLLYLLVVPFIQLTALILASLVNNSLPAVNFIRMSIYLPVVTAITVVSIMWSWMYADYGILNETLKYLNAIDRPVGWLTDEDMAIFALMFVTFWRGLDFYMILYLAGLQSLSKETDEAAIIDGANLFQRFFFVTVPQMKRTIMLCSILSTLAAVKAFEEVLILTQGGPYGSTYTSLYYAFDMGIKHFKLSKAMAASLVVSVVCIALAVIFSWIMKQKKQEEKLAKA